MRYPTLLSIAFLAFRTITATAQISGVINTSATYDQRVYLSGNLTVIGRAAFNNGVEIASGAASPSLTVTGDASVGALAGTSAAPLGNLTVSGQLTLDGPLFCSEAVNVSGSLLTTKNVTKISARRITVSGNLSLRDEQTLILESNGGPISIGGNILGPVNTATRATLVIQTRNGGTFVVSGSTDPRVTLSTSSGSSVGTPMYPINMSTRANLSSGSPLIAGFVLSNADGGAGSVSSRFLVRAIGPGLSKFGLTGAEDPSLSVSPGGMSNDDWSADPANRVLVQDAILKTGAFPIDVGSKDAAIVIDAPPGALTVVVRAASGRGGEVIVEVYRVP